MTNGNTIEHKTKEKETFFFKYINVFLEKF